MLFTYALRCFPPRPHRRRAAPAPFSAAGFTDAWKVTFRLFPATLTLNRVHLKSLPDSTFMMTANPTPVQRRTFGLLDLDPDRDVAMYLAG